MATSTHVTFGFADRAAAPLTVPDTARHAQIGGIDRPRRDGGESLTATLIALIESPQVCSPKFLTCEQRSV
ncbi:hypothetical protein QRB35_16035 [Mycobacterium intracellulare subsp. chimaera]|uniref:Uncharacterized protein n=1 Tax=Mycobacterium intracellulare subsp. chimaera TaxID=222805 RepID=A0ABT7P322_MYCIT|nr:hypothetical protein [Mycobacterium intracellulare subsp. chimaera]